MAELTLTDSLAFYGAFLSTAVFIWNVQSSRPKIKVEIVRGARTTSVNTEHGVYISIKNPSSATAHINSVTLISQYQKISIIERISSVLQYRHFQTHSGWIFHPHALEGIETGFPISIEPRNSHSFFVPEAAIRKMLGRDTRFAAVAQDALWRNKFSRPFTM